MTLLLVAALGTQAAGFGLLVWATCRRTLSASIILLPGLLAASAGVLLLYLSARPYSAVLLLTQSLMLLGMGLGAAAKVLASSSAPRAEPGPRARKHEGEARKARAGLLISDQSVRAVLALFLLFTLYQYSVAGLPLLASDVELSRWNSSLTLFGIPSRIALFGLPCLFIYAMTAFSQARATFAIETRRRRQTAVLIGLTLLVLRILSGFKGQAFDLVLLVLACALAIPGGYPLRIIRRHRRALAGVLAAVGISIVFAAWVGSSYDSTSVRAAETGQSVASQLLDRVTITGVEPGLELVRLRSEPSLAFPSSLIANDAEFFAYRYLRLGGSDIYDSNTKLSAELSGRSLAAARERDKGSFVVPVTPGLAATLYYDGGWFALLFGSAFVGLTIAGAASWSISNTPIKRYWGLVSIGFFQDVLQRGAVVYHLLNWFTSAALTLLVLYLVRSVLTSRSSKQLAPSVRVRPPSGVGRWRWNQEQPRRHRSTSDSRESIRDATLWSVVGRLSSTVALLGVGILFARMLTPEDFGSFTLAMTFVVFGGTLARFGMAQIVVRAVAQTDHRDGRHVAMRVGIRALAISSLGALLTVPLVAGAPGAWLLGDLLDQAALVPVALALALWIAAEAIRLVASEIFRGFHQVREATLLGDALRAVLLALAAMTVWVVERSISLRSAVYLAAACSLGTMAIAIAVLESKRPRGGNDVGPNSGATAQTLFSWGVPVWIASIFTLIVGQGDIWVVSASLTSTDVAAYGAALRTAMFVPIGLLIINSVVPSHIVRLSMDGSHGVLERTVRGLTTLVAVPTVIVAAAMAILAPLLLRTMFGDFASVAASSLAILALSQAVNVAAGPCATFLVMTGYERVVLVVTAATAALILVGGTLAALRFGMIGVAAVSGLATVLQNSALVFIARRSEGIWTCAYADPRQWTQVARNLSAREVERDFGYAKTT